MSNDGWRSRSRNGTRCPRTLQRAAAGVSTEDLILPFFRLSREDSYLGTERRFSRR